MDHVQGKPNLGEAAETTDTPLNSTIGEQFDSPLIFPGKQGIRSRPQALLV